MKRILVPTDFSKPAQLALDVAIGVAQRAQGEIILLHVVEKPVGFIHYPTIPDQIKRDNLYLSAFVAEKKLDLVRTSKTLKEMDVSVNWKVVSGRPYHEILQTISELKIDLVVIGALGESDVPELALGSTAERIVRFSPSPVLTVHERPSCADFAKIVYASSLDENEKYFAEVVKATQGLYQAVIHLVRINTPMNFQPDHMVKNSMYNFARKVRLKNFTINVFSDRSEEEGILHFASEIKADLIAMATHGRTGQTRTLIGSIAEDVLYHSARPVLTLVTK